MKVNGDEFLKNLERQQQRNNAAQNPQLSQNLESYYNNINENPNNSGDQELDDIRLESSNNNKQKYILFGLSLVLLFLITIVTLRLLSDDKEKNNFSDNNLIEENNYNFVQKENKDINNKLNIDEIVQAEENIKVQTSKENNTLKQQPERDLFGLEKGIENQKEKTAQTLEKIVEKQTIQEISIEQPKPVIKKPTPVVQKVIEEKKEKQIKVPSSVIKGIYIQVGAFTKLPDKKLLAKLKTNNYPFVIHKMDIKGKTYNKVLIGGYKNRAEAKTHLDNVKQLFNKNAYILRIK
jgi:DedD protein